MRMPSLRIRLKWNWTTSTNASKNKDYQCQSLLGITKWKRQRVFVWSTHPLSSVQLKNVCLFHTSTSLFAPVSSRKENNDKPEDFTKTSKTSFTKPGTDWWSQLQSPPNIITISRILSAPVLSYWIVTEQTQLALVGCCIAGLSDWFDGYLAKHHGMSTVLGTYLDPLADKIMINVVAVSLWYTSVLPLPLVSLWLVKDILLMGATYHFVVKHQKQQEQASQLYTSNTSEEKHDVDSLTPNILLTVHPTAISKVNTTLQFITLSVAIVDPLLSLPSTLSVLCWVTGATTLASAVSYVDYSAFTKQ